MVKKKIELNIMALIPARQNSKRLKNKNIKKIKGKELIYYPILTAKKSKYINKIIVSSDSNKISNLAVNYGAEAPFLRPKSLAKDKSSIIDTISFTLKKLKEEYDYEPDYILIMQPTSPLISSDLIDEAIKKIITKKADSLIGLKPTETTGHPFNLRQIDSKGLVKFWKNKDHYKYLKIKKPIFYQAGGIYICSRQSFLKTNKIEGRNNQFIIMNKLSSIDIDTIEDFNLVSKVMKN